MAKYRFDINCFGTNNQSAWCKINVRGPDSSVVLRVCMPRTLTRSVSEVNSAQALNDVLACFDIAGGGKEGLRCHPRFRLVQAALFAFRDWTFRKRSVKAAWAWSTGRFTATSSARWPSRSC